MAKTDGIFHTAGPWEHGSTLHTGDTGRTCLSFVFLAVSPEVSDLLSAWGETKQVVHAVAREAWDAGCSFSQ